MKQVMRKFGPDEGGGHVFILDANDDRMFDEKERTLTQRQFGAMLMHVVVDEES
jgi:hypothetical protein